MEQTSEIKEYYPESKNTVTVDSNDESIKVINKANPEDIRFYYFVKKNSLKCYKLFKENKELFLSTNACDKCYVLQSAKKVYYRNDKLDINLCDVCYEKIDAVGYKKITPTKTQGYGFYTNLLRDNSFKTLHDDLNNSINLS